MSVRICLEQYGHLNNSTSFCFLFFFFFFFFYLFFFFFGNFNIENRSYCCFQFWKLNDHLAAKELFIRFTVHIFRGRLSMCVALNLLMMHDKMMHRRPHKCLLI